MFNQVNNALKVPQAGGNANPIPQVHALAFLVGVARTTRRAQTAAVNPQPGLRVRRATVDDLDALRAIWVSMRLPADEMEKQLKEFQVVEEAAGNVLGTVGVRLSGQHALLFGEGFSDFSVADVARQMFWRRCEALAANHGIFRVWTQETSPFWTRWGFQPATGEVLTRLPEEWKTSEGQWLTLELKNEEAVTDALKTRFAGFMDVEKEQTARVAEKARVLRGIVITVGFTIGILSIGYALYLFLHRNAFSP
jgi:N-acetylglutamate synthase-like GNAT family acetyltransferase